MCVRFDLLRERNLSSFRSTVKTLLESTHLLKCNANRNKHQPIQTVQWRLPKTTYPGEISLMAGDSDGMM